MTTASAIVTGGASGIGRALSAGLVRRGVDVVVADIDGDAAREVAGDLDHGRGGGAEPAEVDVADAGAVADLIEATHARHGRLDYLFNNAGIGAPIPAGDLELVHWDRTLDVNLRGVIHGCHAAYSLMRRQGFGHIVNTASLAGLIGGLADGAPYAATKHGVVGLSLALRADAAGRGVHVHVVCPGGVDTPLLDKMEFPGFPAPGDPSLPTTRELFEKMGLRWLPGPERVAADVLRGVKQDRPIIVTPFSARVVWWLWRLAPGAMLAGAERLTAWEAAGRSRP